VVHTLDYPAPVVAMGISADDNIITVGMTDGLISTQHRKPDIGESTKPKSVQRRQMSHRYTIGKGAEYVPTDIVHKETKDEQLPRYDQFLRTFQHSRALDTVLIGTYFTEKRPEVVVALLQELMHRGVLKTALAGREYDTLSKLIKFIAKNMGYQRFSNSLIDVALALIDVYEDQMGSMDERTLMLFRRLHTSIVLQMEQLKEMSRTLGALEMVSSLAASSSSPSDDEDFMSGKSVDPSQDDDNIEEIIFHEVRQVDQMA